MTDIALTEKHAAYLTDALKAFREAGSGLAWSVAASKWRWTPAFFDLPDFVQNEIDAAMEANRQRVNKLAGA